MTLPEAIQILNRLLDDSKHDGGWMCVISCDREAIRLAIGIMERLEDSVPGHPLRPSDGLPFGTTRDSVPGHGITWQEIPAEKMMGDAVRTDPASE